MTGPPSGSAISSLQVVLADGAKGRAARWKRLISRRIVPKAASVALHLGSGGTGTPPASVLANRDPCGRAGAVMPRVSRYGGPRHQAAARPLSEMRQAIPP